MKLSFRLIMALMLGLSLLTFTACGDDDEDPAPAAPSANFTPPTPSDADGFLVAYKSLTTQSVAGSNIDIVVGGAVAGFFDSGNTANLVNGGAVTCEGVTLDQADNNSYFTTASATNPTGLAFSDDAADWTVAGNGQVEAITASYTGFPSLGEIATVSAGDEVSKTGALTLNCNTISDADSVLYAVYSTDGTELVTKSGSSSSHIFEAGELTGLATGDGLVQVTAYKYTPEVVNGKTYYLINETVRTKSVKIVD